VSVRGGAEESEREALRYGGCWAIASADAAAERWLKEGLLWLLLSLLLSVEGVISTSSPPAAAAALAA
jgi:hypothetical protein